MLPFVGPDVEQAIRHTFLLTFFHNAYPIALFFGIVITIAHALYKPSRQKILLALGLSLLLIHFEYMKHAMELFRQQTQNALTTPDPHHRFTWVIDKLLTKIVPIGLFATGVLATAVAILLSRKKPLKE